MIQFNLLPDIKLEFIKARRAKNMVTVVSLVAVAVSVALLAISYSITLVQKHHISALHTDINSFEQSLQNTPDLAKILTIQNQLGSLPALYAKRPVASRIFSYIQQVTPQKVSIGNLAANFEENTITLTGTTDSLESINRYVDTLKFTRFKVAGAETETPAFTDVVLSSFGRESNIASYSVNFKFDPALFEGGNKIDFSVPKAITTRSETELPGNGVFDAEEGN